MLRRFDAAFTAPSFQTFVLLMSGWIGSVRHRFIPDLIVTGDSTRNGHHSDYHRFFSHAKWSMDELWKILAHIVIEAFVGAVKRRQ
ncbi:MAG: hypothetical protein KDA89_12365 [Planctomycetaceae bacterium]|nr:hypothetical protein [Planctomycetaceae bacterium]